MITKAFQAIGEKPPDEPLTENIVGKCIEQLTEKFARRKEPIPNVEDVQDAVETALMSSGHPQVAKAFILYRQRRSQQREEKKPCLAEQ